MKKGFTLIELVVVIALISILAVTLGPRVLLAIDKSKVSRVLSSLSELRTQLRVFHIETGEKIDDEKEFVQWADPVPETLGSREIVESKDVVLERTDEGGWVYDVETEEIYANLPNGNYTGKETEIWNGEFIDEVASGGTTSTDYSSPTVEALEDGSLGYIRIQGQVAILDGDVANGEPEKWITGAVGEDRTSLLFDNDYENYEISFKYKGFKAPDLILGTTTDAETVAENLAADGDSFATQDAWSHRAKLEVADIGGWGAIDDTHDVKIRVTENGEKIETIIDGEISETVLWSEEAGIDNTTKNSFYIKLYQQGGAQSDKIGDVVISEITE